MTPQETRELQELLLTHYLFAIEEVKKADEQGYEVLLYTLFVSNGVCYCAKYKFGIDLYEIEPDWISRYSDEYGTWGSRACFANTKQEAIELLQIRVTNLQNELQ